MYVSTLLSRLSTRRILSGYCSLASSRKVRLVLISDTHSWHDKLGPLPAGDILIHAGDFTESRPPQPGEYKQFIDWFSSQPHRNKLLISGNRDQFMDTINSKKYERTAGFWMEQMQEYVKHEKSIVYLEDKLFTLNLEDGSTIKIYGTPWTAIYGKPGKAFQIPASNLIEKWKKVPKAVDILITHMPPFGILDVNSGNVRSGCKDLAKIVTENIKPRIHVFGHIHESHGWEQRNSITFINAASRKPKSKVLNNPIIVDYYLE